MHTVDLKKDLKHLYSVTAKSVELVDVPELPYLMLDGSGDPNTAQVYKDGVSALYGLAYTLRALLKTAQNTAYTVMPLEGLWWVDDMADFSYEDKSNWQWTLLILQPDGVTEATVAEAKAQLKRKKPLSLIDAVRLERYHEGLSAQILHTGPFAAEPVTIAKLDAFCEERGYAMNGKHHEIYMSNLQRTPPEKLKTIIRHPVQKA